jgi:hypothetical protein
MLTDNRGSKKEFRMTAISDGLRYTKLPRNNGSGDIPLLGFGTLIPDPVATKQATRAALEVENFGVSRFPEDAMSETGERVERDPGSTELWRPEFPELLVLVFG